MTEPLPSEPPKPPNIWSPLTNARLAFFLAMQTCETWVIGWTTVGLIIVPIVMMFAGAYKGLSFFPGLLLTALVIGVGAFSPVIVVGAYHSIDFAVTQNESKKHYARELAAWNAGAGAREIAARRARAEAVFDNLLSEYAARQFLQQKASKEKAARRRALESQLAEAFRQFRLRNDWDGSDPALTPRLHSAFKQSVHDRGLFSPEDWALLATSADPATRDLLPPQLGVATS